MRLPVEVIVEQEMNCSKAWYLESINRVARVLSAQQGFYAVDGQEALQPLVFIVMACDEANVAVAGLVSTLSPQVSIRYINRVHIILPFQPQCSPEVQAQSRQTNQVTQDCWSRTSAVALDTPG